MLSVTLPGHVLEAEDADERPVWLEHGTTYVYVKYNNLYLMAVTQRNSNAAMILLFLYRLVEARGRCSIALASAAAALGRLCAARRVGRRSLTPPRFCAAGLQGLLQGAGGGVDPGQLCDHV